MGRSKTSVRIEEGRKRVVRIRHRKAEDWSVMILAHHEGYIDLDAYRGNQELMAHNTNGRGSAVRGSIRGGSALPSGLLRCGHCGAKLCVAYPGATTIRYQCTTRILSREHPCCVMFGGLGADRLVAEQVLRCLELLGLQAALRAVESLHSVEDERIAQKRLALQRARYEVSRAQRQYDVVDPANRLVAGSLEKRWNDALAVQSRLEDQIAELMRQRPDALSEATKEAVLALAEDLPRLWQHPETLPDVNRREPARSVEHLEHGRVVGRGEALAGGQAVGRLSPLARHFARLPCVGRRPRPDDDAGLAARPLRFKPFGIRLQAPSSLAAGLPL
jgi:hypothetical protein